MTQQQPLDKPIIIVPTQPAPRTGRQLTVEREWSDTYAFKSNLMAMREIRRIQEQKRSRRWYYINATLALLFPFICLLIAGYLP